MVDHTAGRGVGMDVVKKNVHEAGGKIGFAFSPGVVHAFSSNISRITATLNEVKFPMTRKVCLLIIDPSAENRRKVARVASELGLEICEGEDEASALNQVLGKRPHIIFLNTQTWSSSPIVLLGKILKTPRMSDVRIITVEDENNPNAEELLQLSHDFVRTALDSFELKYRFQKMSRLVSWRYKMLNKVKNLENDKKSLSRYVPTDLLEQILTPDSDLSQEFRYLDADGSIPGRPKFNRYCRRTGAGTIRTVLKRTNVRHDGSDFRTPGQRK